MVGGVSTSSSSKCSGMEGRVNLFAKVVARRFALVSGSCVQLPLESLSDGRESLGGSLLRSCLLIRYHCFEFRGKDFSLSRSCLV